MSSRCFGPHLIAFLGYLQFLRIWATRYHYRWVSTYQMNIGQKLSDLLSQLENDPNFKEGKVANGESKICTFIKERCLAGIEKFDVRPPEIKKIDVAVKKTCVAVKKNLLHSFAKLNLGFSIALHKDTEFILLQGFNEVGKTNAYVGDALVDGTALKTDYFNKRHGLTDEEAQKMSICELNDHHARLTERSAWKIAGELKQQIDDQPGPGGRI